MRSSAAASALGRIGAAKIAIGFAIVLAVALWISLPLIKRIMSPGAPNWITGVPPAERQAQSSTVLPPECRFTDLPEEFEYDAVGVYQGKKAYTWPVSDADARLIGQSFVGAVSVLVTVTERPVVLLLTSYTPAVWNIKAAPGAVIAGIAYSGYGPAGVFGDIPSSAKVIDLTRDAPCGAEHSVAVAYEGSRFRQLQALAIALADAKLSTIQGKYDNDSFIVGPGGQHISDLAAIRAALHADFTRNTNLHGKGLPPDTPQIQALIGAGAIRPATADEVFAWETVDPELTKYGLVRPPDFGSPYHAYMILKPFVFPEGMSGGNAVTFILPVGMEMPSGDPGHNTILLMDWSGDCIEWGAAVCAKQ
jgi:hypothetical protein